jgi:hypothetical protein
MKNCLPHENGKSKFFKAAAMKTPQRNPGVGTQAKFGIKSVSKKKERKQVGH